VSGFCEPLGSGSRTVLMPLSRDNLDENSGGNQSLKRRPVAKS
jgi:hypothetical protein